MIRSESPYFIGTCARINTFQDDIVVSEDVQTRQDDLTEEERQKWEKMHEAAEKVLHANEGEEEEPLPEGLTKKITEVVDAYRAT